MTRLDLFKKYHDMACHNLLCCSANYLMEKPKEGYKKEWNEARQEVEILEELIREQTQE
ncbi:hypothetical protein P378_08715 [Desulforamulus profundi]|uniref:Uncharacterized protein n=1 Tax=Desulforamulus profundi TaxID=1383067 RepID=A0A2C6M8N2_9FIRM|nr:hypothetical protein [Desulforamulus profundi]PHJ38637.1 hypothetical protein P378_08715 [Desulforamulus profundi]